MATPLYETLDFAFSSPAASAPSSPAAAAAAADDDDAAADGEDRYTVFRRQITTPAEPAADVPVTDYFSLFPTPPGSDREDAGDEESLDASSAAPAGDVSDSAWFRKGSRIKSPMLQLHKEIVDFANFMSPTPEEEVARSAAVDAVSEVIKYIWPDCRVEVFGSFQTGLYLPTSDIDVVILDSNVLKPQTGLYALARALSQRGIARKMQVIAKARVPIVKFVEKKSGIAFDVSFDIETGPKAADFIKDSLMKLPPLRPLCMVLKVFLQQRELNEVFSGGIGSYALLAMLIAHLQMYRSRQDIQIRQQPMEHNLGVLLVNFFELYGRKLNTSEVGVSCSTAGTFYLKQDKGFLNTERPYLLSIEDPQEPGNDIGKSSFNYFKVRSAFAMAYSSLTDLKAIRGFGQNRGILGTIIRPDPVLLERRGGCNGELTFEQLLPGAGEPVIPEAGMGQDMVYNWQVVDDDEPLPRGNTIPEDDQNLSRGRRRRSLKVKGDTITETQEENGRVKQSSVKKQKNRKGCKDDGFGSGHRPRSLSSSR